ncbi:ABC transporter ATP-binding protein [Erysipelothrix urinaevulpis]|uniref:ABC transporter ATP-binding protein n=1 Tax=Erysipelothrix urinaevulpis TaxID=2683717 RepID=UPI001356F677|nr:ABC transporter ATP-binding protein [Erysipelothrix urinaevulpis]
MEILKVENLVKTYKQGKEEIYALNDISFSIQKGEFVAVMGPSGSGKSTLMHILGCVDKASSGKIYIDGMNISEMNEKKLTIFRRRQIGLIYQFYNLIPMLNVQENIELPLLLDNAPVDRDYFDTLIDQMGLDKRLKHHPNELSGGQQQRVSIARALMNKPSLILADEPTGNLDQENSLEIVKLLKKSHREHMQTIIVITHDINIAKQAERVIYLEDGKIIKDEVL